MSCELEVAFFFFFLKRYTHCLDREATAILVNSGREMSRAAKLLPSGNARYRLLAKKTWEELEKGIRNDRTIAEIVKARKKAPDAHKYILKFYVYIINYAKF